MQSERERISNTRRFPHRFAPISQNNRHSVTPSLGTPRDSVRLERLPPLDWRNQEGNQKVNIEKESDDSERYLYYIIYPRVSDGKKKGHKV